MSTILYEALKLLLLCAVMGFATYVLTGVIRSYAIKRQIVDIPNQRSSHSTPTPRGGGLSIVLAYSIGLSLLWLIGKVETGLFVGLFGAGSVIATIGFMDDHRHIPPQWRLVAHILGAAWGVYWLGGVPILTILGYPLDLGWLGYIVATFLTVWLLNLYNFMDGIDGIAGIEAATVCFCVIVLLTLAQNSESAWLIPLLLLAAVVGFLFWNFPKAKIFMGDVGSGFVGVILALLSIQAAWVDPSLLWCWFILLGVFIVDATLTLVRRVWRGERFYEPHCSHAYQNASRWYCSHAKVSLTVGFINLFWLFPIAIAVSQSWIDGLVGTAIGYGPLVWMAFYYKAGISEN